MALLDGPPCQLWRGFGGINLVIAQDGFTLRDLVSYDDKHNQANGLIALRHAHPVFQRRRWFHGRPIRGTVDLGWCKPDGAEMSDEDWDTAHARAIGLFLNGRAITAPTPVGGRSATTPS